MSGPDGAVGVDFPNREAHRVETRFFAKVVDSDERAEHVGLFVPVVREQVGRVGGLENLTPSEHGDIGGAGPLGTKRTEVALEGVGAAFVRWGDELAMLDAEDRIAAAEKA